MRLYAGNSVENKNAPDAFLLGPKGSLVRNSIWKASGDHPILVAASEKDLYTPR